MGGRLDGVADSHLLRVRESTIRRTHVKSWMDVTLMKQKSIWMSSPGLRMLVFIVIPFGTSVIAEELQIQQLVPQVRKHFENL